MAGRRASEMAADVMFVNVGEEEEDENDHILLAPLVNDRRRASPVFSSHQAPVEDVPVTPLSTASSDASSGTGGGIMNANELRFAHSMGSTTTTHEYNLTARRRAVATQRQESRWPDAHQHPKEAKNVSSLPPSSSPSLPLLVRRICCCCCGILQRQERAAQERWWGRRGREAHSDAGSTDEYYEDSFNDQPWSCTFGTTEDDGIWMNTRDQPGTIMSFMVWILIIYAAFTVTLLAHSASLPPTIAMSFVLLCALSLASHAKTTFTDPGAVPQCAVPIIETEPFRHPHSLKPPTKKRHAMCSQCQAYKPQMSHHCRICNRCICRMDHHCPWMNNCIGAGNLKHFILFLVYTWTASVYALLIFGWNYFLCADDTCTFDGVLVQLVRVMTVICVATLLFTTSMIMNVTYGIMTGIGTIDRLKKKANDTILEADEEPIPLKDIFGIGGYHTWLLPIDPLFEDYDRVMGFSTTQRLLREMSEADYGGARSDTGTGISGGSREYVPV